MKKILQISNYLYPHIGGIEQVARDFANAMKGEPVIQKIICFNETASDGEYVCNRKETVCDFVDDIEIIRCGCFVKVASQSLSLSYPFELKKVMDEFQPDIVVFHYPNPFVAHLLLKYKRRNFKLLVYWHLDITKQRILGKLFHGQNLKLIKRADKILGATPKHVNESAYSSFFGNKKYILPYMIDESSLIISDEEIAEAKRIRDKYRGKVLGFFIGRHVQYKGLTYLVKASKILDKENIHFLIAGSGELTESLMQEAKDDPKIEFLGRITDSQRRSYLYACDIFCFPSITRNEAFGLALAEGMYFGKPAITFTIPGSGVNYVSLNGVTGIECQNCDATAYAKALKKLADNAELREKYGAAAQQRVVEHFTTASFVKNVRMLIEQL